MPAVVDNEAVVEDICLRRRKAKLYYDRQAKSLPELQIGQPVKLQPGHKGNTWKRAVTVDKLGDRSYLVQTNDGATYRRNRKFIRAVPNSIEERDNCSDQINTTPFDMEVTTERTTTEFSPPEMHQNRQLTCLLNVQLVGE